MNWIVSLNNEELINAYNSVKVQDAIMECTMMFLRPLTPGEVQWWDNIAKSLYIIQEEVIRRFGPNV